MKSIRRMSGVRICAATMVMAGIAWFAGAGLAADAPKGAQRLNELTLIKTTAEAQTLKPGDMIAMACVKCKSMTVTFVGPKSGKATEPFVKVGEKHLCPGCNTTMEVAGVQKGAHTELKHLCATCGDDSAYCCATRHGPGKTPGMEKN